MVGHFLDPLVDSITAVRWEKKTAWDIHELVILVAGGLMIVRNNDDSNVTFSWQSAARPKNRK